MEAVKNYSEFLKFLLRFKKENDPTHTNFFLLGDKLKRLIEQNRIFYEIKDNCLVIVENQGEYNHFYYCLNANGLIPEVFTDKTNVSYLVYNQRMEKVEIEAQRDKLLKAGFEYRIQSFTYGKTISDCADIIYKNLAVQIEKAKHNGVELGYMKEEDYKEIDALWRKCFDALRVPDISQDLQEIVNEKRIIVARKKTLSGSELQTDMSIVGITAMDFQGKTVHTQKTCVHLDCRGMGIGKLLVLASLSEAMERGCKRWLVEIDEGNTAAEKMHFGAFVNGPSKTGIIAEMFVKRQLCTDGERIG